MKKEIPWWRLTLLTCLLYAILVLFHAVSWCVLRCFFPVRTEGVSVRPPCIRQLNQVPLSVFSRSKRFKLHPKALLHFGFPRSLWAIIERNTETIAIQPFAVPWARSERSEQASERVSAAELVSEVSRAEQANEWVVRANERMDEKVALHSWLFWPTVPLRNKSNSLPA